MVILRSSAQPLWDDNLGGTYGNGTVFALHMLPGDANGDGKVDINDLTIVLAHFNQTGMIGARVSSPATAKWTSTT